MNKQGQRSMKTAIKNSKFKDFSNKGQKLGIILENKVVHFTFIAKVN